jgi:hypothetical protein
MRTSRLWSRAALAVTMCVGIVACGGPTDASDTIDVAVAVDRVDIDLENPAHVTITVTNRGAEPVEAIDPRNYACFPSYVVRNAMQTEVPLPGRYCLTIGYAPRTLASGESMTFTDRWSGEMSDHAGRSVSVAPGLYRLSARVFVGGRERNSAAVIVRVH